MSTAQNAHWARLCCRLVVAFASALAAPATDAGAQEASMAQIHASVDRALALQKAGQFEQSTQALQEALVRCSGTPFQVDCRRIVLYSLGYLNQMEARRDPANQARLLQSAVTHYQALLTEQPQFGQAIYNLALVYREMGPHEWQEPFLRDAPSKDPSRRATYETLLGDYYQDRRMWDQAITSYRRALQANADDPAPRSGLLDAYRAIAPARNQELLALAGEWTERFPDLATEAYELIVRSAFASGAAPAARNLVAEQALVRWVARLARLQRIDVEVLKGIPTGWTPTDDLRRYLDAPYTTPPFGNWWMNDENRGKVLAEVALALGQRKLAQGEPARTEACWTAGMGVLPPFFEQILDLKRELAMLYFRRPELDRDGRKFNALERELFMEKAAVLGAGNLEAAQRYHTALGLIYFEKKTWQSPRRGFNAVDQLTWALNKASEREAREKFYQPLPELRSMLAQALEQTPQRAQAPAFQRAAAQTFLDTDDLTAAADASTRAAGSAAARPYASLIAFRQRIEALTDAAPDAATVCERAAIERALAPPAGLQRDAKFTARQRFKLLADCSRLGPEERRLDYAAEVIALAVQDSVTLVGIADLLRLQRASTAILGTIRMPFRPGSARPTPAEYHIEFDTTAVSAGFVRISLATSTRAGRIDVPGQIAVAALLTHVFGRRVLLTSIDDSEMEVQLAPDAAAANVTRRLVALRGVRSVQSMAPGRLRIRL